MDDDALFSDLRDKLFTAVVCDALDKLGSVIRPDARVDGHHAGSGANCDKCEHGLDRQRQLLLLIWRRVGRSGPDPGVLVSCRVDHRLGHPFLDGGRPPRARDRGERQRGALLGHPHGGAGRKRHGRSARRGALRRSIRGRKLHPSKDARLSTGYGAGWGCGVQVTPPMQVWRDSRASSLTHAAAAHTPSVAFGDTFPTKCRAVRGSSKGDSKYCGACPANPRIPEGFLGTFWLSRLRKSRAGHALHSYHFRQTPGTHRPEAVRGDRRAARRGRLRQVVLQLGSSGDADLRAA